MMKKLIVALLLALLPMAAAFSHNRPEVTLETLLKEMTDRDAQARYPQPFFNGRQASSYDRRTTAKDKPEWFANVDRTQFIRVEKKDGRKEYVMMDENGPGAIVRFWMTFAGPDCGKGTLRIYLDGSDSPVIEGPVLDIVSGDALVGEPLASSVSRLTPYMKRGHNLYLPIPYSSSCKVTYESERLIEGHVGARGEEDEKVYYNIGFRQYGRDTRVETFSMAALERASSTVEEVCRKLSSWDPEPYSHEFSLDTVLEPGAERSWTLSGRNAIRYLSMSVAAEDGCQALRSLILKMSFDGENTVWVPVGDFFGTGYKTSYTSTRYDHVEDGRMEALWVMPFRHDCEITLVNLSKQTVSVTGAKAGYSAWKWDSRSMHFGVSWHQYTNIQTGHHDGARDLNFATLLGQGVYVGDGVTLFNTAEKWWGEGDEKVYVDWEAFPSSIGTGTEDYYGYAWGRPEVFTDHPFIAQPIGEGAVNPGYVSNRRYRALDGIPFAESLIFDMELFHWAETRINYAPVSFWYLRPGGRSLIPHDTTGARTAVKR